MNLREQAEMLRRAGYSYGMIGKELNISKSTTSNWLSRIPFTPNQEVLRRVGEGRMRSAEFKRKIKQQDIDQRRREAVQEIGILTKRDLFILGLGLYLGEGSKSIEEVRIVNTNLSIMKLALLWFYEFCGAGNDNIKITIHGYPDTNIEETLGYWSRELGISMTQFNRTIIDNRSNKSILKKGKTPYGTAHLYIKGKGKHVLGIKSLHRKIIGWIDAATGQI